MTQHSPWWYRLRGAVMGTIYLAGFFGTAWSGSSVIAIAPRLLLTLATLLVIAGWAIRVWGSSYLSARVVWNPDAKTNTLLVDGPFRYLRNPLYFGNALLALGIGMLATPLGLAVIVLGHAIFLPMLMSYEASGLRAEILSACFIAGMLAVWFGGPHPARAFIAFWIGGWIVQRLVTPPLPAESA